MRCWFRGRLLPCLIAFLFLTSSGSSAQVNVNPVKGLASGAQGEHASTQIRILPGDLVSVTVFDVPELSRDVRVSEEGTIHLPLLEDVPVGGLTEPEAAHSIDEAYLNGHFLLHPQTSILIREFATKGVSIVGEVGHPNIYPVPGQRSLLDVIALAGGLTSAADTHINIKRRDGSIDQATVSLPVDNGTLTLENDVSVGPGDRVIVPRAKMVYVLGEVARPGAYIMQINGTLTVLQAIAAAGGTTRVAGENSTKLIRRDASGFNTEAVPLHRLLKGKAADFALQPADVLYVPDSTVRNLIVNAPAILGTLAGAAIYSVNR